MGFTVHLSRGGYDTYGDSDEYHHIEGGLLEVIPSEESKQTVMYSASGWASVEADRDHKPGLPKGAKGTAPPMPRRLR